MLTFDFSGLQIYLRPGNVPFATVPNIRLAHQMSDNCLLSVQRDCNLENKKRKLRWDGF